MGHESQSFEELKIYPLKTLALETKQPHEVFYEYDPNQINIKINAWRKGIQSLNEEESLRPEIVKINKEAPMQEFAQLLSNQYSIPVEFLAVMKRNPKLSITGVDVLSDSKSLEKKISKLRINDGVNIYIEDSRIQHPDLIDYSFLSDGSKKSKWETEFELEKN